MPVAYLLSHQAGLAWVDGPMTLEEVLAWDPVVEGLAEEAPKWEPGTKHGYHATTYGWLVGEVVRRITGKGSAPTCRAGRRAARARLWIGLPESEEPGRHAHLDDPPRRRARPTTPRSGSTRDRWRRSWAPTPRSARALFAPGGALDQDIWNPPRVHAAEVPAANGICDARSLARLYAASIGEVDGIRLLTPEQVKGRRRSAPRPEHVLMDMEIEFGLGFMLATSMIGPGWPELVRPLRRRRLGGLGRPGRRARVRLHHEPDGHRPRR